MRRGDEKTDNFAVERTRFARRSPRRYAYSGRCMRFEPVGSGRRGRQHRRVDVRYYIDPETDRPHIHRHGVVEQEVEEVLRRPLEDRPARDGSRIALGQTQAGRYLRVIYVPDPQPDSVFVVTAYQLGPKALRALRRRRRRRR